jgi:hypothetical protein
MLDFEHKKFSRFALTPLPGARGGIGRVINYSNAVDLQPVRGGIGRSAEAHEISKIES